MTHSVSTVKSVAHFVEEQVDPQDPTAHVVDVVELVKCQINFN
tara:strand:- start:261 stop:389 length:129 start_codon:yes stop_codon:yes gene_type:complete